MQTEGKQVLCGKRTVLETVASALRKQGETFQYVQVVNPATGSMSPGLEFSKDVYSNMIGSA